jgi:Cu(I)/Ag(I) efflux system membrane protein CusA/SilA
MAGAERHGEGRPRSETDRTEGPIARVIAFCAREPLVTCVAVLAAFAFGIASLRATPLDAIPDLSDVQVIVSSEWPGQSPDQVEDQLTYPISTRLLSTPGGAHGARSLALRSSRSST